MYFLVYKKHRLPRILIYCEKKKQTVKEILNYSVKKLVSLKLTNS